MDLGAPDTFTRDIGAPDTFTRDLGAPDNYHIEEICLSYIFLKLFFKVLSIFIRALTSDINEIEAAKRSKTSKNHMEERLARGFVLLRYATVGNLESCQIYERNSESKHFSKCLLYTKIYV